MHTSLSHRGCFLVDVLLLVYVQKLVPDVVEFVMLIIPHVTHPHMHTLQTHTPTIHKPTHTNKHTHRCLATMMSSIIQGSPTTFLCRR